MKKIIFLSAVATFLLSAVSAFVYANNDKDAMDDLFHANVEALANGEGATNVCYNRIKSAEGQLVRYCPMCSYIEGKPALFAFSSHC